MYSCKQMLDATHISQSTRHGSETVSIVATDAVGFYFPGDAKVQYLDHAMEVDPDVCRLDVSVNYPVTMKIFQSPSDAEGHIKTLGQELTLRGYEVDFARLGTADGGLTTAQR